LISCFIDFFIDDAVNTLKMHMKRRKRGGLTISKVESSTVVGDLKIKATPSNPNDPFGKLYTQSKRW
jgi:hypothetical protein